MTIYFKEEEPSSYNIQKENRQNMSQEEKQEQTYAAQPAIPQVGIHPNSLTVEYDELTFRVRKGDRAAMTNSYLALLLQNVDKASQNFVVKASQYIRAGNGILAKKYIDEYIFFLEESVDSFSRLGEILEETLILDSKVEAHLTVKPDVPYNADELNEAIKESTQEIQKKKKEIKKRKESKAAKKKAKK